MNWKSITALAGSTAIACALGLPAAAMDVTIAQSSAVNTLDPHESNSVSLDLSVLRHIYPTLIVRQPDYKLVPALAKSWEPIDDLTWKFTIVENAKFDNGEPIDAETVKWNIERVINKEVPRRMGPWFAAVKGVEVISPTEFLIKTLSPYPILPAQLSMLMLLPPKWAESHNPVTETVSGFAYKVSSMVPGDHITLVPNETYWGDTPAQFDSVTFRVIPEASSRIAALLAGEVDLIDRVPISEIKRIDEAPNASAGVVDSIRSIFLKFNTEVAPLENKKFRQALNYAVDKDLIVDALFGGQASVSQCQVMSSNYFGYNPDLKPYPYDPEKAKALLAESGVDLNQTFEFDVPSGAYLQVTEVAQAVAQMLAEVGVKTQLNSMEFGAFMNKFLRQRALSPFSLIGFAQPSIDADGLLTYFKPDNQYAYWHDSAFGGKLSDGISTIDEATRIAAYREATQIMCDEAPVIFLYAQPSTFGVSDRVEYAWRGDDWLLALDMKPKQ